MCTIQSSSLLTTLTRLQQCYHNYVTILLQHCYMHWIYMYVNCACVLPVHLLLHLYIQASDIYRSDTSTQSSLTRFFSIQAYKTLFKSSWHATALGQPIHQKKMPATLLFYTSSWNMDLKTTKTECTSVIQVCYKKQCTIWCTAYVHT